VPQERHLFLLPFFFREDMAASFDILKHYNFVMVSLPLGIHFPMSSLPCREWKSL
jgi:hypothetical protein